MPPQSYKRNLYNARPVPKSDMKIRDAVTNIEAFVYDDEYLEAVKKRTAFWRVFPFHMCKHYLGINLKPFQAIILYQMFNNANTVYIASRSQGKTWLTAVACVCYCILYPGSIVVVASGVKSQAFEIFQKISKLYKDSPMLREEILFMTESKQDPKVEFKNGSMVLSAVSSDNSRGMRAHFLILDEFRMIDKDILDSVLRKFLGDPRHPKYLDLPEYEHLLEDNKSAYLSSAWTTNHWSYEKYKATIKQMAAGKPYFCCNLPYQLAVKNGLKKMSEVINEMTEADFDPVKWKVEMEGHWLGEAENALFNNETINNCRKIEKAIYPLDVRNRCGKNEKKTYRAKAKEEIRLLFADIALMSSNKHKNDASCFGLMCLTPNAARNDYLRDISYLETWTGQHSEKTALRLRKLYEELDCDYLVMDANGVGLPIFDLLVGNPIIDKDTGVEYQPLACVNDEEMNERCLYPNNPKVIWSIKAYAQLNSDMAVYLSNAINSKKLRFLVHENDGQDYLTRFSGYDEFSGDLVGKLKAPYVQTSLAIYEMLSLEAEHKDDGKVRVKEQSGKRKDRYSAIAMANYVATELSRQNFKVEVGIDEDDDFVTLYGFN